MLMLIARLGERNACIEWHFNTSHVNVNPVRKEYKMNEDLYFNTSHVNVNLSAELLTAARGDNFNTSHVNVNPVLQFCTVSVLAFQYISC